jgi:nitrate/nitrite transporter NarK
MELLAVSGQQSANALFLMSFAESRKLARRPYGGLITDQLGACRNTGTIEAVGKCADVRRAKS